MKTDAIFYELIKDIPQKFFDLIGQSNIDISQYKFSAPELKQQSFRLDGIFTTNEGCDNQPLYFVELQTYKDKEFYERLFGEIFVYFRQYQPPNHEWYAVVVYDRRSNEILPHPRYGTLISQHILRIYLNEISSDASLNIAIARLLVETPTNITRSAKQLATVAQQEITDASILEKVLTFIQTIVVYKLPNMSLEEIEAVLDLSEFKNSRFYESVKQRTKLELVPKLLEKGMSIQDVAELLELDVEEVRKAARQ